MTKTTLQGRLDSEFAPAWRPEPGDKLVGSIVAISERTGQYEPYPIVTVRQGDGTEVAFHAFHTVAASELARQRPKLGDVIGIKYVGKRDGQSGASYHAYRVEVDRDEVAGDIDWGKYGAETPASDVPSDLPSHGQPATHNPDTQQEASTDDIPF